MARIATTTLLSAGVEIISRPIRLRAARVVGSHWFWAMADQAAASLGNFATNILLARQLSRESYGTFGLILEIIFFLNAIQSALITYPLSVRGATCEPNRLGRYATASLLLTMLMAAPVIALAMTTGALSGHLLLAACASLALLLWQMQETLRRTMLTHLRHADAIWGDALSYLGQAVGIVVLIACDRVTLQATFGVIALTSAVGAMVQLAQVGLARVTLREVAQQARDFWSFGRYVAANNLLVIFTTLGYQWVLTCVQGRAAVAELYAVLTLLKLTNPLMAAVVGLIVPASARAHQQEGAARARHVAARYAWLGAALLVPYLSVLIVWPLWVIELVFGHGSIYGDNVNVLRLYTAWTALTYAVTTTSAYLNAVGRSRLTLAGQATNAVVSAAAGLPMAALGGLVAAAAGTVLAVGAQLGVLLHLLAQHKDEPGEPQQTTRAGYLLSDQPLQAPWRNAA